MKLSCAAILVVMLSSLASAAPGVYYSVQVEVGSQSLELMRYADQYRYVAGGVELSYDGEAWSLLWGDRVFLGAIDEVSGCGLLAELDADAYAAVKPGQRSWPYEIAQNAPMYGLGISFMLLIEFLYWSLAAMSRPIRGLRGVL